MILDRIRNTSNNVSLDLDERSKVEEYIKENSNSGKVSIRKSFFQSNNLLDKNYLQSYSLTNTKKQVFLDFAKTNGGHMTTTQAYNLFPNASR